MTVANTQRIANEFVFGLDIGGTGIQCGLFQILEHGKLARNHIWQGNLSTNKGVEPHVTQVAALVQMAIAAAKERHGKLVGVGVASPGRFRNDVILPGTSPNMGLTTDEFDGVCLEKLYISACHHIGISDISIVVRNDADAMMIGLLEHFPGSTKDITIGYLGLGTGLGNSFIKNGHFINDGHLSQILITIDSEDVTAFSRVYQVRGEQMLYFNIEKLIANLESLVCMPTLKALTSLDADEYLNIQDPTHQIAIDLVGKYLAKGMMAVRGGDIHDINPDNQWSDDDIMAAQFTSVYLLGGAVMRDSDVANRMAIAIDQTLAASLGAGHDIKVVPMGYENPAVYAAAQLFMNEFIPSII